MLVIKKRMETYVGQIMIDKNVRTFHFFFSLFFLVFWQIQLGDDTKVVN